MNKRHFMRLVPSVVGCTPWDDASAQGYLPMRTARSTRTFDRNKADARMGVTVVPDEEPGMSPTYRAVRTATYLYLGLSIVWMLVRKARTGSTTAGHP